MAQRCRRCETALTATDAGRGVCDRCLLGAVLALEPDDPQPPGFSADDAIGTSVGPYEIVDQLGEGGMGIVYLAEQKEPFRRRVALKLIKLGMDTREVIARFESERQTLALMDHPSIARVYDAGVTDRGGPYFAMEYVDGVPITEYCDAKGLDLRRRLRLFVEVCRAIQHAHQKGVIHRDVKPSNVLVGDGDPGPVVKVIDFGVAKAIDPDGGGRTRFTHRGVLVGTPEYMSPEQAESKRGKVDTRTDVYALGLLQYELLAGTLPFVRRESIDELRRRIVHDEPARPSSRCVDGNARAERTASKMGTDPSSLRRALRGDLDWIVLRALEKDPARRYGSPNELAADIERHLAHEPVAAGPPGAGYRMRKFARRHRVGVGFAASLLVLLLAFLLTLALQTRRIARERDRANREADAASFVSSFLVDLFEVSDPGEARGDSVSAREILDRGAGKIERELVGQPELQARLMATMGRVYINLGHYDDAARLLERSRSIREAALGSDDEATLHTNLEIGELLFQQGKLAEAESLLERTLERLRATQGEEAPDTMAAQGDLAVVLHFLGRLDAAEGHYRAALDARRRVLGPTHPDTLETLNNTVALLASQGKLDQAEPLCREAYEGRRATLGPDHPETIDTMTNLAVVLQRLGRYDEAEPLSREAVEIARRVRPDHPKTLVSVNNHGKLLELQGKLEEAEPYYAEALRTFRESLGGDHADTISALGNLGNLYAEQGRYDEAVPLLEEAVEAARRALPAPHVVTGYTLRKYGHMLTGMGRYAEAEAALLEARSILEQAVGPEHARSRRAAEDLAALYELWGRPEDARRWANLS
jgi:non-specific serine/threonine protein kinase/serine/threonine-protein kinase